MRSPDFYFEFDNSFGTVTAKSLPAEFAEDVVAEGIEISFQNSEIMVTVEPWKFSGRSLAKQEEYSVATADDKQMLLQVLEDSDSNYLVRATLTEGENQDNIKLMINTEASADNLQEAIDQVRDIVRSVTINISEL